MQNLAKQHRDILIPDEGKLFSYVDYDQYEAGIMAALSGDSVLTKLYAEGDLYEIAAESIFRDVTKRKEAKRLFLSYAYGMRHRDLIDAAYGYGADRQHAKVFLNNSLNLRTGNPGFIVSLKQTVKLEPLLATTLSESEREL